MPTYRRLRHHSKPLPLWNMPLGCNGGSTGTWRPWWIERQGFRVSNWHQPTANQNCKNNGKKNAYIFFNSKTCLVAKSAEIIFQAIAPCPHSLGFRIIIAPGASKTGTMVDFQQNIHRDSRCQHAVEWLCQCAAHIGDINREYFFRETFHQFIPVFCLNELLHVFRM